MKKKFLAGLTAGLFMVALAGLSQAAPDSIENTPGDVTESKDYEMSAVMKTLKKMLRDKELREIIAAGSPQAGGQLHMKAQSQ